MFWNVVRMENDKIFKRKIFWIEMAILALVFILIDLSVYLSVSHQSPEIQAFIWPGALNFSLTISSISLMGGILMIVLVGLITAQEYSWRTMQLWLSNGISRSMLIGAKTLTLLIPVVSTILASVLIGGGLSALLSLLAQGTVHAEHVNFGDLFLSCLVQAFAMLPYLSLTFAIAIVSRSALLAVSVGLVYTFVVETLLLSLGGLLKGPFAQAMAYLPTNLAKDVMAPFLSNIAPSSPTTLPSTQVGPAFAAICIIIYTVVLCAIAFWTFSRQNMTN